MSSGSPNTLLLCSAFDKSLHNNNFCRAACDEIRGKSVGLVLAAGDFRYQKNTIPEDWIEKDSRYAQILGARAVEYIDLRSSDSEINYDTFDCYWFGGGNPQVLAHVLRNSKLGHVLLERKINSELSVIAESAGAVALGSEIGHLFSYNREQACMHYRELVREYTTTINGSGVGSRLGLGLTKVKVIPHYIGTLPLSIRYIDDILPLRDGEHVIVHD